MIENIKLGLYELFGSVDPFGFPLGILKVLELVLRVEN
jgi:hypothetical protein